MKSFEVWEAEATEISVLEERKTELSTGAQRNSDPLPLPNGPIDSYFYCLVASVLALKSAFYGPRVTPSYRRGDNLTAGLILRLGYLAFWANSATIAFLYQTLSELGRVL